MVDRIVQEIGAIVTGNRGFREGKVYFSPETIPYGGMVKAPVFVVTHQPRQAVDIGGMRFTFTGGIGEAVELAKRAAGKKSVAVLGASIDRQCLQAGLADEIVIHLAPLLLGEGIRLFEGLGSQPIELERTDIVSTAEITSLRFRVLK
jgi:dihydrofolate reductase